MNKKIFQTKHCVKHGHIIRFQSVYCAIDELFSSYHNTEYYFNINIPAVNTEMFMLIETYDCDRFNTY